MTWQRFKSCTGSGLQVSKIIVMKNPHYVVVRSWPRYPLWLGTFIFMFTWIDTDTALVFRKRAQACLGMIKTPANGCCASYGLLAGHSASKARGHNSWIFMNTANCRYKQEEWFLPTQTWTLHGARGWCREEPETSDQCMSIHVHTADVDIDDVTKMFEELILHSFFAAAAEFCVCW